MKTRHKIINLVHPDAAETPYRWAFKNFYDAREHIKALGNKTGDTTSFGGEKFKPCVCVFLDSGSKVGSCEA